MRSSSTNPIAYLAATGRVQITWLTRRFARAGPKRDRRRARGYPFIDQRCEDQSRQRREAFEGSREIENAQLLHHVLVVPALSARSSSARDATVPTVKMTRVSPRQVEARTHRNVNSAADSPLSNFLPSGSMSFTLKISSNSTPAILLTLTALHSDVE